MTDRSENGQNPWFALGSLLLNALLATAIATWLYSFDDTKSYVARCIVGALIALNAIAWRNFVKGAKGGYRLQLARTARDMLVGLVVFGVFLEQWGHVLQLGAGIDAAGRTITIVSAALAFLLMMNEAMDRHMDRRFEGIRKSVDAAFTTGRRPSAGPARDAGTTPRITSKEPGTTYVNPLTDEIIEFATCEDGEILGVDDQGFVLIWVDDAGTPVATSDTPEEIDRSELTRRERARLGPP